MKYLAVLLVSLSLYGCGALEGAVTPAQDIPSQEFSIAGVDTFRVTDDARSRRIIIRASFGSMASAELNDVFTFGVSHADASEQFMRSAALGYLQKGGRHCELKEGHELSRMEWAFVYECSDTISGPKAGTAEPG